MGTKKKPKFPPSAEAREQLLIVMRSTTEPIVAASLSKLLVTPYEISADDLSPILDEYVAAGRLFAFSPKSVKGKPRYWDRDLRAFGRSAVLDVVRQAEGPLTVKEILKRLVLPFKFSESELTGWSEEHVEAGTVHAIPPATAKGKSRYWHRNLLEFGQIQIQKGLDEKGPQTEANLQKLVKGLTDVQFREILENALSARAVWRHPPLGKPKKSLSSGSSRNQLYGASPPSPEPYLREVGTQLTQVVSQLIAAQVPQAELRRALVQLIEAAGIRFGQASVSDPEITKLGERSAIDSPLAVDLIDLMRRLEPGAERGALIGCRDLRQAAELEKSQFDTAVLELARQGRLSLHRHDYVHSLNPAEREELVTDGNGTYYVGVALRQSPT